MIINKFKQHLLIKKKNVGKSKKHSDFLKSSLFGFAPPCEIDIKIAKLDSRKNGQIKDR